MSSTDIEEISRQTKIYVLVFAALAVLTLVTVAVSYLDLSTGPAIVLALIIATMKGSLVVLFFMHLISERKLIYAALAVTLVFVLALLILPLTGFMDQLRS